MMIRYMRNNSSASATPSVAVGRPTTQQYMIEVVVRMVRSNSFLKTVTKIDMME